MSIQYQKPKLSNLSSTASQYCGDGTAASGTDPGGVMCIIGDFATAANCFSGVSASGSACTNGPADSRPFCGTGGGDANPDCSNGNSPG